MKLPCASWVRWSVVVAAVGGFASAQNSTVKRRAAPSATAARAGGAVTWRPGLKTARAESARSGKPVFWYVPTLAGSPMDRTAELDRYMMAGPFSSPDVVALLDAGFVPVRQAARGAAAKEFDLQRGAFVEPGFLVLDRHGKVLHCVNRLTTLYPSWIAAQLRPFAAEQPAPRARPAPLARAWSAYAGWDDRAAEAALGRLPADGLAPELRAEDDFLRGAILYRSRRAGAAREVWRQLARRAPDQPLAWKAAAEAEGLGPFVRGFEDYRELPDAVLVASPTSRAPAGAYDEAALRRASRRFLLAMQQHDGSYVDSWYDFGGTDSLPNVYMAVTAIAGWALLEDSGGVPAASTPAGAALARLRAFVVDEDHIAQRDTDEIVWAHVYRLHLLARWLELAPGDAALRPVLSRIVAALAHSQRRGGGWQHEYANPFVTASVLIALDAAAQVGVPPDGVDLEAAVRSLLACRAKSGGFSYYQSRGKPRVSVVGSAGRMPLCELALALRGNADQARLLAAVRQGFEHHELLEAVRKYDDHADRYGYGGFFFWYDMVGRTLATRQLADASERKRLLAEQHQLVLSIPEYDGCFVDSHEIGRVYGTASALLCLAWTRP